MKKLSVCSALALVVVAAACEKKNPVAASATSTSSSGAVVVDAATGVTITTPTPTSPADNADVKNADQPVTLTVANAVTTSTSAPTYSFEVATDSGFGSKVYTKDGVAAGNGQTSLTIDKLKAATTYYWRAHITVNGTAGPNSKVRSFKIGPEVILQAPVLADPGANATVSDTPTLTVNNVQRQGPAGTIFYRFEVSDSPSFSSLIAVVAGVEENTGAGYTQATVSSKLDETTYWWRAQASDPSNKVTSPYSSSNPFKVSKGLDLRAAHIVLGPSNIASWEQTAQITDAYWANGQLCIYHTRLGIWPGVAFFGDPGTLVEGNQWVFMFKDGQWHGGAADWYRPGQACKAVDQYSIGRDAFYVPTQEPLHSWVPQSGEVFGLMSSTPARLWPQMSTYDERTNVVLTRWP